MKTLTKIMWIIVKTMMFLGFLYLAYLAYMFLAIKSAWH